MEKFIAIVGLTWIITESKIFKPFREYISKKNKSKKNVFINFLDSILNCSGCFGFWAALMVYFVRDIELIIYLLNGSILSIFALSLLKLINRK